MFLCELTSSDWLVDGRYPARLNSTIANIGQLFIAKKVSRRKAIFVNSANACARAHTKRTSWCKSLS